MLISFGRRTIEKVKGPMVLDVVNLLVNSSQL